MASISKGKGRHDIPVVNWLVEGMWEFSALRIWKRCMMFAKKRKISIRASDSPTHARLPTTSKEKILNACVKVTFEFIFRLP
jgi:hypothetical protein